MSFGFIRPLLRRAWWWVFSILIAGPALVLALFGLRAIRVDRIEREQQLREQQTQVARLADATIANAVERLIAQPRDGRLTDEGRFEISSNPRDHGAFKTPTLREIARTAPYMHDGSMATLEEGY